MKKFINKIVDLPKLTLRVWICLWICLIILLFMKFCFGIWYPIVIKNQALLEFNKYIDNSWLKYLIFGMFYLLNGNLLYKISTRKIKYHNFLELFVINFLIISTFIVKCFTSFGFIGEIIVVVILPIIYNIKANPYINKAVLIIYPILIQGIVTLWQYNILLVRNLPVKLEDIETIFQVVLQLDYYTFLIILWIGVTIMGLIGFWLFVRDVTKLKAIKEQELAKENPNTKMIKDIDARIAKLEASSK